MAKKRRGDFGGLPPTVPNPANNTPPTTDPALAGFNKPAPIIRPPASAAEAAAWATATYSEDSGPSNVIPPPPRQQYQPPPPPKAKRTFREELEEEAARRGISAEELMAEYANGNRAKTKDEDSIGKELVGRMKKKAKDSFSLKNIFLAALVLYFLYHTGVLDMIVKTLREAFQKAAAPSEDKKGQQQQKNTNQQEQKQSETKQESPPTSQQQQTENIEQETVDETSNADAQSDDGRPVVESALEAE